MKIECVCAADVSRIIPPEEYTAHKKRKKASWGCTCPDNWGWSKPHLKGCKIK